MGESEGPLAEMSTFYFSKRKMKELAVQIGKYDCTDNLHELGTTFSIRCYFGHLQTPKQLSSVSWRFPTFQIPIFQ